MSAPAVSRSPRSGHPTSGSTGATATASRGSSARSSFRASTVSSRRRSRRAARCATWSPPTSPATLGPIWDHVLREPPWHVSPLERLVGGAGRLRLAAVARKCGAEALRRRRARRGGGGLRDVPTCAELGGGNRLGQDRRDRGARAIAPGRARALALPPRHGVDEQGLGAAPPARPSAVPDPGGDEEDAHARRRRPLGTPRRRRRRTRGALVLGARAGRVPGHGRRSARGTQAAGSSRPARRRRRAPRRISPAT